MALLPELPRLPTVPGDFIPAPEVAEVRVFTDGSFKDYRFHVALPNQQLPHGVTRVEKTVERKLQIIDRPLVDGANVHDFGRRARAYTADIVFFGPDYLAEFNKFEAKCEEGTAGKLILPDHPKAILAMFKSMSVGSSATDGESLTVSVQWVDAEAVASPLRAGENANPLDAKITKANAAAIRAKAAADNALEAIRKNTFLKNIRVAKIGISRANSAVNSILGLGDRTKDGILEVQGELEGTINLAKKTVDIVAKFVGLKKKASNTSASESTTTFALGTDPITGQQVIAFNEEKTATVARDPLAKPDVIPTVEKSLPEVATNTGATLALVKLADSMAAGVETLQQSSDGRVDDVAVAVARLNNVLAELEEITKPTELRPYLVRITLSLNEVLFFNGLSVDQADEVYKNNTHIGDVLAIDPGTVVYL